MTSLATRIVLTSVGSLALVFALIAGGLYLLERRDPAVAADVDLSGHMQTVQDALRFDAAGRLTGIALPSRHEALYDGLSNDVAYRVLDEQGRVVLTSPRGRATLKLERVGFAQVRQGLGITRGDPSLRIHTVRVSRGNHDYYLQVARSDRFVRTMQGYQGILAMQVVLGAFLLALIVFTVVLVLAMRRIVAPLRNVSEAARNITPAHLAERIPLQGLPRELAPLVESFNGALQRLETGFRVQQEFLASAAHELKTPLALLRAEIEIRERPEDRILLDDIDFMSRQVHQLLHLAEVSEAHNYQLEQIDAAEEVGAVLSYLDRLTRTRQVRLSHDRDAPSPSLRADRGAFFVLVKNLVENAILHSPPLGVVRIHLSPQAMTVSDEGGGIAADDLERIFDRFWRGPGRAAQGAGLGLPICAAIAQAHGWIIRAQNNVDAPGASFRVEFLAGDSAIGTPGIATSGWERAHGASPAPSRDDA